MKRKIVSSILVICLMMTGSVSVFGATAQDQDLENAIKAVKTVIEIPDNYIEFQYSTYEYQSDQGKTGIQWELYWHDKDYRGGISATVDQFYNLIFYNNFSEGKSEEGIGTISNNEAGVIAKAFLKKAIPDEADKMRQNIADNYSAGNGFGFSYTFYENDIPVMFKTAEIIVNKYTGEVSSFSRIGADIMVDTYPSLEKTIGLDDAKSAYLEKIGLELQYKIKYDYNKRTVSAFPAYVLSPSNRKAIDATTGEFARLDGTDYGFRYASGTGDKGAAEMQNTSSLSKSELEEVEKTANLLSQSEAIAYIEKQAPEKESWEKPEMASLSRDSFDKTKYIWSFHSKGSASASINASTGELLSYYNYKDEETGTKSVSIDNARKQVESFLNSIASAKFAQTKPNDDYMDVTDTSDYYYFSYVRQVNGIDVNGNNLDVGYNKKTGKIVSYGSNWHETITFPAIDTVQAEAKAFDVAAEIANYQMMYAQTDKEVKAFYYFDNMTDIYLDPFTLDRIDSDGGAYKQSGVTSYDDIAGKWYENMVNQLLENGYYIDAESFDGNARITQEVFLRYLLSPSQKYYSDTDSFYEMLMRSDLVKEGEKAPEALLLRQDAAKFVIRNIGLAKAAEKTDIYLNMFKDTVETDYKGYAALCYGLGIFSGDKNGNFNGTYVMTNAEAAAVIYNYLNAQ